MDKREWFYVSAVFLIALAIRIYISTVFYCQSSDEFSNIYHARCVFDSGFKAYPRTSMWFYYFVSALLLFIIKDAFVAVKAITVLFGACLFIPVYLVTKRIFGKKVALLSIILLLINPEFTVISSTPLREPVYAFFIFLSLFLLLDRRILVGAFSVGMSFLTRMEGFMIGMPYYLISLFVQKPPGRLFKLSAVSAIFVLFLLFMNLWVARPFLYFTHTLDCQAVAGVGADKFVYAGLPHLILRLFFSVITFVKYSVNLIGPNIIFMAVGFICLFRVKNWERKESRAFTIAFLAHIAFWMAYVFIFKKLPFDFHRYLYSLIPFAVITAAYGFFSLYRTKGFRHALIILLSVNIVAGYFIYYLNVGRRYVLASRSNKELLKASLWLEENVAPGAEYKILADGAVYFYLCRNKRPANAVMWDKLYNEKRRNFNIIDVLAFIKEHNIKYIVWQNDNLAAMPVASYFNDFSEKETNEGKFIPLAKFCGPIFKALIYKFDGR